MVSSSDPRIDRHLFDPGELASMAYMTNIDRRQCVRTVPMKVLGLGVSRTGTVSLRQALIELGFGDCYHYSAAFQENPKDQELWIEALQGKFENGRKFVKQDWDQLLGHCQAVTDTPCTIFWEELLETYPDAKIILTVRDNADTWFASQMATIMPFFDEFVADVDPSSAGLLEDTSFKMNKLVLDHYSMYQTLYRDSYTGEQQAKNWYEDYIAAVKERVPADNLLVFNVKEGWKPLCDFLGVAVPNQPFPKRNDRSRFQKNVQDIKAFLASQET